MKHFHSTLAACLTAFLTCVAFGLAFVAATPEDMLLAHRVRVTSWVTSCLVVIFWLIERTLAREAKD